jgi:hypothetical protein
MDEVIRSVGNPDLSFPRNFGGELSEGCTISEGRDVDDLSGAISGKTFQLLKANRRDRSEGVDSFDDVEPIL